MSIRSVLQLVNDTLGILHLPLVTNINDSFEAQRLLTLFNDAVRQFMSFTSWEHSTFLDLNPNDFTLTSKDIPQTINLPNGSPSYVLSAVPTKQWYPGLIVQVTDSSITTEYVVANAVTTTTGTFTSINTLASITVGTLLVDKPLAYTLQLPPKYFAIESVMKANSLGVWNKVTKANSFEDFMNIYQNLIPTGLTEPSIYTIQNNTIYFDNIDTTSYQTSQFSIRASLSWVDVTNTNASTQTLDHATSLKITPDEFEQLVYYRLIADGASVVAQRGDIFQVYEKKHRVLLINLKNRLVKNHGNKTKDISHSGLHIATFSNNKRSR